MNSTKNFNNPENRNYSDKQPNNKSKQNEANYAFKWTFIAFIICVVLYGIMYMAVNADNIGLPAVSKFIRKSPLAPALMTLSQKQNILILGTDSNGRNTDPFSGTRSDTILVVSLDKMGKAVNAISIPRDSKVFIAEGHGINKINAAHAFGGPELAKKTIENTFGINIDHYIVINFHGVKDFVEALGGINVNVEKRMHYTDRSGGLYIDLYPGYQKLSPEQAEGYLRFRHDAIGDIGRMRRQQWFVRGIVEKLKSPDVIAKVPAIIQAISKNIKTDMNPYQLAEFATFAKQIDVDNVQTSTLPGKPSNHGVVSYWIIDAKKTQSIIDRLIYREEPVNESGAPLSVTLLYSEKYRDQIPAIEEVLKEQGFEVKYSSSSRTSHTQITANSSKAGFSPIMKLKAKLPELKSAQFIVSPADYNSDDSDYTIVLSD